MFEVDLSGKIYSLFYACVNRKFVENINLLEKTFVGKNQAHESQQNKHVSLCLLSDLQSFGYNRVVIAHLGTTLQLY